MGKVHNLVMKKCKKEGVQVDDLYALVILVPGNSVFVKRCGDGILGGDAWLVITEYDNKGRQRNRHFDGGGAVLDANDKIGAIRQRELL